MGDPAEFITLETYNNGRMLVWWRDRRCLANIPSPLFRDGQFVMTTTKHHSGQPEFTQVIAPRYSELRGWVYGQRYIKRDGSGGSCSFSWEEDHFEPLRDALDILLAERLYLRNEIKEYAIKKSLAKRRLTEITSAIKLIEEQQNK